MKKFKKSLKQFQEKFILQNNFERISSLKFNPKAFISNAPTAILLI